MSIFILHINVFETIVLEKQVYVIEKNQCGHFWISSLNCQVSIAPPLIGPMLKDECQKYSLTTYFTYYSYLTLFPWSLNEESTPPPSYTPPLPSQPKSSVQVKSPKCQWSIMWPCLLAYHPRPPTILSISVSTTALSTVSTPLDDKREQHPRWRLRDGRADRRGVKPDWRDSAPVCGQLVTVVVWPRSWVGLVCPQRHPHLNSRF